MIEICGPSCMQVCSTDLGLLSLFCKFLLHVSSLLSRVDVQFVIRADVQIMSISVIVSYLIYLVFTFLCIVIS